MTWFLDNVCIAARDIDGDGKVEVAVGANWNPGETNDATKSGSVHFLIRPEDPTGAWKSVKMPTHDPTVHRMHWMKINKKSDGNDDTASHEYRLLVLPLHGKGNKEVRESLFGFAYVPGEKPEEGNWDTELVDASFHITHNFDLIPFSKELVKRLLSLVEKKASKAFVMLIKGI